MENIVFDSGIREFRINGAGVLRFNPSDPNLYSRFLSATDRIEALEKSLTAKAAALPDGDSKAALSLMEEADGAIKDILTEVFGKDNDFRKLLGDLNLLAVGANGQRLLINLLEALSPVLVEGAELYAESQAAAALARMKKSRRKAAQ